MSLKVVPFSEKYKLSFERMNLAWMNKYIGGASEYDKEVLENPQKFIVDPGGKIFVLLDGESVIGTAAILRKEEHVYELAKMSVAIDYQGKGLGKFLAELAIKEAKALGGKKVILETNASLRAAIRLYEKLGFRDVSCSMANRSGCDMSMEVELG